MQADPHLFSYYRIIEDQSDQIDFLLNRNQSIFYMFKPHLRKYLLEYWKLWLSNPDKLFFPEDKKRNNGSGVKVHSILEMDKKTREKQASIRVQLHKPIDSFKRSEVARKFITAIQELLSSGRQLCLISYPVSSDYRAASKSYMQFSEVFNFSFRDMDLYVFFMYFVFFNKF